MTTMTGKPTPDGLRERLAYWEKQEAEHQLSMIVANATANALRAELRAVENGSAKTDPPTPAEPAAEPFTLQPERFVPDITSPQDKAPRPPTFPGRGQGPHRGEAAKAGRAKHASPGEMRDIVLLTLRSRLRFTWATTREIAKLTPKPPSLAKRRLTAKSWKRRIVGALGELRDLQLVDSKPSLRTSTRRGGKPETSWRARS